MRNKTEKLTSIRIMPVFVLASLVVLGSALAKPARDPVSGFGSSVLNLITNTSSGHVTLFVRGEQLDATLAVQLLEMVYSGNNEEAVFHATALSTLDFGGGDTFTTTDKIVGVPKGGGLYKVNEKLTIISGTGAYNGASGNLSIHGEAQFPPPGDPPFAQVCFEIRGAISPPAVLIETVTVNSNDLDGEDSTMGLLDGIDYRIEVSGTWTNKTGGPDEFPVDAEYVSYDGWISWQDGPNPVPEEPGERKNQLDLQVNQTFVDWGPYSSDHIYSLDLVGSDSTVNFRVWDGLLSVGPEPGWYPDNGGSLTVKIYQLP